MTSSRHYDAIVVGGGHNGLVCAAVLAGSGRKVLVLEAASEVGGALRGWEFAPGFRSPGLAPVLNRLHGEVIKALDLKRHGLAFPVGDLPSTTVLAEGGDPLILNGAYGERLAGASATEGAAWTALRAQLLRHAGILKPFLFRPPPSLGGQDWKELFALAGSGLALKRLGADEMRDFLRMLLTNVADVADEHLSDDRLKGLLAFDATLGAHLGPRSPTSLLGLYFRLTGDVDGVEAAQMMPVGGMAAFASALWAAAKAKGVEIRTGARVGRILVENARATGVELESGEVISARTVISAANPVTTFLGLVGVRHLDAGFVTRLRKIRMAGNVARLTLALDGMPELGSGPNGRFVIAPSVDHVERGFNPAKYGELSAEPLMEFTLPSVVDRTLAPEGGAVLAANVQFAPYRLREGWDAGRPRLEAAVLAQLERHVPGISRLIRHVELLAPPDMEGRFGMPGGHWHHGELQADQMLVSRPLFGAERYDTPVGGLFLCSAGSHPGGGISGAPGLNAARRVIDMRQ